MTYTDKNGKVWESYEAACEHFGGFKFASSKPDFEKGDDLSDLLGGDAPVAPAAQPQGEQWARIRSYADQAPAAKAFEVACSKCNGSGTWRGNYRSGPCFTCKGTGKLARKTAPATLARAKERRVEQKDAVRAEAAPQIAWLQGKLAQNGLPEGYAKMLGDFLARLQNGQALSDNQLAVIAKGQARDAEWAAQRQEKAVERIQAAPVVDVSKIVDAYQRAQEANLKRFTLRFNGLHLQLDRKDRNLVWVSAAGYGSAKFGLIKLAEGTFRPGRDFNAEAQAALTLVAADPMTAAKAYAQVTSNCSVCGLHLENQDSVDAGMGPICAGRINRPGLKFEQVAF